MVLLATPHLILLAASDASYPAQEHFVDWTAQHPPLRRAATAMVVDIWPERAADQSSLSAAGGRSIVASAVQLRMFVHDFGVDVEQAGLCPRIDGSGPDLVTIDRRLPADLVETLAGRVPRRRWTATCFASTLRGRASLMEGKADGCLISATFARLGLRRLRPQRTNREADSSGDDK